MPPLMNYINLISLIKFFLTFQVVSVSSSSRGKLPPHYYGTSMLPPPPPPPMARPVAIIRSTGEYIGMLSSGQSLLYTCDFLSWIILILKFCSLLWIFQRIWVGEDRLKALFHILRVPQWMWRTQACQGQEVIKMTPHLLLLPTLPTPHGCIFFRPQPDDIMITIFLHILLSSHAALLM